MGSSSRCSGKGCSLAVLVAAFQDLRLASTVVIVNFLERCGNERPPPHTHKFNPTLSVLANHLHTAIGVL